MRAIDEISTRSTIDTVQTVHAWSHALAALHCIGAEYNHTVEIADFGSNLEA